MNNIPGIDIGEAALGRLKAPSTPIGDALTETFAKERGALNERFNALKEQAAVTREVSELTEAFSNFTSTSTEAVKAATKATDTHTTSTSANGKASKEAAAALAQLKDALAGLTASVSPAADAAQRMAEAQNILTASIKAGLVTQEQAAEIMRRTTRDIVGVGNAVTDYTERQKLLNDALASGAITSAEFDTAMTELGKTIQKESTFMEDALGSAFESASDALADFVTTGKLDFKSLADSILKDLTKLALNDIFKGGGGGFLSGLFGGGGGLFGGGGQQSTGGGLGSLFSGLSGLFGFANGGGFTVGGNFGTDRNVLSINDQPVARVSRGEAVNVSPNGSGGSPTVIMNIQTPNAESFERSQGQILARTQAGLARANRRNN
jgi:lambda family phage tail tape measure protein